MTTEFHKPADLRSAVLLLERYGEDAVIVNGGTDIVIEIAQKRISPQAIVYVEGIAELQGIRQENGMIILGGAVTYLAMQRSPICRRIAGLMRALSTLGSPGVRAVATPAGNIATAAPSADCATMLMALEAEVVLSSARGDRVAPLADFFIKRGQTALQRSDIIREIRFPAPAKDFGTGYARVARRKAQDIGKALVGASVHVQNGVCVKACVSLGALNATVVRASSLERALIGKNHMESVAYAESRFPEEAGLRASYFKHYKELVTTSVVAKAVDMAWRSAAAQ